MKRNSEKEKDLQEITKLILKLDKEDTNIINIVAKTLLMRKNMEELNKLTSYD